VDCFLHPLVVFRNVCLPVPSFFSSPVFLWEVHSEGVPLFPWIGACWLEKCFPGAVPGKLVPFFSF